MPKDNLQSSYAKQQFRINQILKTIQSYGQIHKFELMEKMQIPLNEYYKLKQLLEYNGLKQSIIINGDNWICTKEPEQIKKENLEAAKQEAQDVLNQFKGIEHDD